MRQWSEVDARVLSPEYEANRDRSGVHQFHTRSRPSVIVSLPGAPEEPNRDRQCLKEGLQPDFSHSQFVREITALLVIDPYNDFLSEGGRFWPRLKAVAEANNCVPKMLQVLNAARAAKLRVFYPLHRRYRPGDYETWKYVAPIQKRTWSSKAFEYGTWGGEIRKEFEPQPGETMILEHWGSSAFANTDLDLQLKKHGIHQLVVIGLIAHTCVEATVRYAFELGYEVTMVRDATADYSDVEMHAALAVNIPNYAAIVTTAQLLESIASL